MIYKPYYQRINTIEKVPDYILIREPKIKRRKQRKKLRKGNPKI